MANVVYFDPAVGGSGLTVSDDGDSQFGLDNDGHRVRFVPALQNLVYIGNFVKQRAADVDAAVDEVKGVLDEAIAAKNTIEGHVDDSADSALLAEKWASQLTYPVADTRWSAREYANQAKSIADSMVNNVGLSRVDGGDSFTSIWSSSIDGGSSGTVATVNINCGNAI